MGAQTLNCFFPYRASLIHNRMRHELRTQRGTKALQRFYGRKTGRIQLIRGEYWSTCTSCTSTLTAKPIFLIRNVIEKCAAVMVYAPLFYSVQLMLIQPMTELECLESCLSQGKCVCVCGCGCDSVAMVPHVRS